MDEHDMRNAMLMELIDKMHGRMADKAFPDVDKTDAPAALPISETAKESDTASLEMPNEDGDISDEELDEMMTEHAK